MRYSEWLSSHAPGQLIARQMPRVVNIHNSAKLGGSTQVHFFKTASQSVEVSIYKYLWWEVVYVARTRINCSMAINLAI
jgi:hypothetical protein